MTLKNLKAAVSLFLIVIFSSCASLKRTEKNETNIAKTDKNTPDWTGADINSLPIAKNAKFLSVFAYELSYRSAPLGQKIYSLRLAKLAHTLNKEDKDIAIILSRSAFMVADAIDDKQQMKINAETGIKAAELAGISADNPVSSYYYAINLGLILKSKGLSALKLLPKVLKALQYATAKPDLDKGGPLRVLGMLYLKAPSWPTGIGDLDKSLEYLEKAAKQYPHHPQNLMFYAQALMEDDDNAAAKEYLLKADKLAVPEIWGIYFSKKWRDEIKKLLKKVSDD